MFMLADIDDVPVACPDVSCITVPQFLIWWCPGCWPETVTHTDIIQMGHGPVCSSCKTYRYPRCSFGKGDMELSKILGVLDCLETGTPPFALTAILSHRGSTPRTSGSRMRVVMPDGTVTGYCRIPKPLLDDICDNRFSGGFPTVHPLNLEDSSSSPYLLFRDTLFIFGAGHVGFVLAQLAHLIGFSTVVTDDQRPLPTKTAEAGDGSALLYSSIKGLYSSYALLATELFFRRSALDHTRAPNARGIIRMICPAPTRAAAPMGQKSPIQASCSGVAFVPMST